MFIDSEEQMQGKHATTQCLIIGLLKQWAAVTSVYPSALPLFCLKIK